MIEDFKGDFGDGSAIDCTGVTTEAAVGNPIDLGIGTNAFGDSQNPNIGTGSNVVLVVKCSTAFTDIVAGIMRVRTDDDETYLNGTEMGQVAVTTSHTAGEVIWRFKIPYGDCKRYIGLTMYGTTGATTGEVIAVLGDNAESTVAEKI